MTTLTRSTSRTTPAYKDYVNFLGAYKNGRKEESPPPSKSSTSDVTDFSKNCVPFNTYVHNSKSQKFTSVKPSENKTQKSEIFIEIQPVKSVGEVSKIFENNPKSPAAKTVNSKISVFERQISREKPKLAGKPVRAKPVPVVTPPPAVVTHPPVPVTHLPAVVTPPSKSVTPPKMEGIIPPPPPPPPMVMKGIPLPPSVLQSQATAPPPPMVMKGVPSVPKIQATLTHGPQVTHTVSNPNGVSSNGVDRNDPMVKKLVYGTLRGLYGAYHDKANDIMATLPRDRVKKSNGVQDIIDKIASNGDLDKLNGRVNPKSDQE